MEKKKWPWKRRSSERSPGEGESPGSGSGSGSQSERYSDEQASQELSKDSPEIASKPSMMMIEDELQETVKNLTEKLSAALVNVSAKEDLVKQHSKVAEEAVAGWEKAENEVAALKQQLEAATQQNLSMEVRVSHLDGALKECVRQLRQGREEQEKMISDAVAEKGREWESTRAEFEARILDLQAQVEAEAAKTKGPASVDPQLLLIVDTLEKENLLLKQELVQKCRHLESIKIERDLSTQTAETASKLQLESIKKVAKLEAECRRLQFQYSGRKSSPGNNQKAVVASCFYAESMTDSHSDSGERLHTPDGEPSFSDSWASALIVELDQFKNDKPLMRALRTSSFEIDMMDDFLEMERLAALLDSKSNTPFASSESASGESICLENPLRAELDLMTRRVAELEEKLEKIEAEKNELEKLLDEKQGSLEVAEGRIAEAENKLREMQKDLTNANESKELLEVQLISVEAETRTLSANIDSLKVDIEKEQTLSAELTVRCRELEDELAKTVQETEMQQNMMNSDSQLKIKQEDLAVASDKLAECQKTIASLGQQLKSLATLEDFLIDTSNIPGFSTGLLVTDPARTSMDSLSRMEHGNGEETPSTTSVSALSSNHTTAAKTRNGFGKFFSRSKAVIELNDHQD